MEYIEQGIQDGYIKIDDEQKFITYLHSNKKYRFSDPEEKVRAEIYLQIIYDYGYKPERMDVELIVPRRTPSDLADIVVFDDDDKKKPYIVVECKKTTVSEAEFVQAIEQGFGNAVSLGADWVWVTSGLKSKYYSVDKAKPLERITNIEATIPMFGKTTTNKAKFYYGGVDEDGNEAFDIEKVEQDTLTKIFGQAHQALWAGGKRNPSEAFDELDKLIFCKLWDEKADRKEGEPYDFQEFKKEDPEFLLKRIKAIYEKGRIKDPEVFREQIRLSATELKTIVGYLAPYNIGETDLDAKGRAFEKFLGAFFRGDFGQYFTPREVVDFVVKVLPITKDSKVLDTSCGSGGFLLYALDKVRNQATEQYPNYKKDVKQYSKWHPYWHNFAKNNLYGIEISEGIARTAKMNMIIHDDGHTNVVTSDGLISADFKEKKAGETQEEQKAREKWNENTIQVRTENPNFKYNSFDYIITNPPFGSTIKLTEQAYLRNFNLGIKDVNWIDQRQKNKFELGPRDSQSTEVLFIEQCYRFLKPGGMLAIVIPDGVLTNSSGQYVRDWIEEHYRIISVVSLPQDAFKANDAGVKSSVMFLQKLTDKQTESIKAVKAKLQDTLWKKPEYSKAIEKLEKEKAETTKEHIGFDYSIINWESEENLKVLEGGKDIPSPDNKSGLKLIEKTEEFKQWKADTNANFTDQINEIKEKLLDEYLTLVAQEINDYKILMAITENIGYDASGKDCAIHLSSKDTIENGIQKLEEIKQHDLFSKRVVKKKNEDGKWVIDYEEHFDNVGITKYLKQFIIEIKEGNEGKEPLTIEEHFENKIFITSWRKITGNRFDPKKYSKLSENLISNILNSSVRKVPLKSLVIHSVAGDWGLDENENVNEKLYSKCLVIRATEFDNSYNLNIDNKRAKYRLISKAKLKKLDIKPGDLLLEKSGGSPDQPVGRIAILEKDLLENNLIAFSNFIHKFRVNTDEVLPEYLFCFLKTIHNIKITDIMQSQTNGIRNLIMREYWNQQIILPSLIEQKEIADKIYKMRAEAKQMQINALIKLENTNAIIEKLILE